MTSTSQGPARKAASFGDQTGAASPLALIWIVALLVIAGAGHVILDVYRTRATAVTAADLAALAGAQRLLTSNSTVCSTAAEVSAANGARLQKCRNEAQFVQVQVAVTIERGPLTGHLVTAIAKSELRPAAMTDLG